MSELTALLAHAAHNGVTIFWDDNRGAVIWSDDRADPRLLKTLDVYAEEISELLKFSGFWGCSCPKCQAREGIH
jgi:hypothetical protein